MPAAEAIVLVLLFLGLWKALELIEQAAELAGSRWRNWHRRRQARKRLEDRFRRPPWDR